MAFLARLLQNFLEIWFIPVVLDLLGGLYFLKIEKGQSPRQIIAKMLMWLPVIIFVSTLFITIMKDKDNSPNPKEDISITDTSFDTGVRGLASLYDDNIMPIWFESDLDDVWLNFKVDNNGSSYADIRKTKLIIDSFQPITMDDILLLRSEGHAGIPSKAASDVDLSNIKSGKTEYKINFKTYWTVKSSGKLKITG